MSITLIHSSVTAPDLSRPEILLRVDRLTMAKRIWRGSADDGVEFGFDLQAALKDGDTVFETPHVRYVVRQAPEPVVEISLDVAPSAAAGIGWAIGNLHVNLAAEPDRLLAADEPAIRALLGRLSVPYQLTTAVFRPGRFARGKQLTHELGAAPRH